MLFAGGQGQNETVPAVSVLRAAHQPARKAANELHAAAEHAEARPAERAGQPQALSLAANDIGTKAAGVFQKAECQRFREGGDEKGFFGVGGVCGGLKIFDAAEKIGRLDGHGGQVREAVEGGQIGPAVRQVGQLDDLQAGGIEIGSDHPPVMGVDGGRHGHAFLAGNANRHQQGLGQGRGAVVVGGGGDLCSHQAAGQRLVLVDGLEGALTDFRLIGRVGGHEFAAGQNMPGGRRYEVIVAAGPHEHFEIR